VEPSDWPLGLALSGPSGYPSRQLWGWEVVEMDRQATSDSRMMPVSEALEQMLQLVERVAMLHYHFASTLVSELGEERGRELVSRAIASYGREVGERQRRRLAEAGYEPSCENYRALPDLPPLPWTPEGMPTVRRGDLELKVCPLAKYWIEKGAEKLGRLYCHVDQAKFAAFDPECECRHPFNVLDGDDHCEIVARKRSEWETIDKAV